jgi:energy-converting hydrogenase Eha subunit A
MSMKAIHAVVTLVLGFTVGLVWLRTFWNNSHRVPAAIIAAPVAAALLGLGHWIAYDFSLGHWAGDFSLLQAVFNVSVAGSLLMRRTQRA